MWKEPVLWSGRGKYIQNAEVFIMATTNTSTNGKGAAMKSSQKSPNKEATGSRRKQVSSSSVLELYQECLNNKRTHKQFLSALIRLGHYRNEDEAQERLNRLNHYVSKRHGAQLKRLRAAPRLPTSSKALMDSFSCLVEK